MPFDNVPFVPMPVIDPHESVPTQASNFLSRQGWLANHQDPRNGAPLYQHSRYGSGHFRWYEAVAMEMLGLMQVGHD